MAIAILMVIADASSTLSARCGAPMTPLMPPRDIRRSAALPQRSTTKSPNLMGALAVAAAEEGRFR
jgi:hypothetical protein